MNRFLPQMGGRVRCIGAGYATIRLDFGGLGVFEIPWWRLARNPQGHWLLIGDPIDLSEGAL